MLNILAQYMPRPCVYSSVRPSVRMSEDGIVPKWLNLESRKQRYTIVQERQFSVDKDLIKFEWYGPNGASNRGG